MEIKKNNITKNCHFLIVLNLNLEIEGISKMVKVYSKDNCTNCMVTKNFLKMKGIEFEEIDITKDQQALSYVQSLGYSTLPVVVADKDHWAGYNAVKLSSIAQK